MNLGWAFEGSVGSDFAVDLRFLTLFAGSPFHGKSHRLNSDLQACELRRGPGRAVDIRIADGIDRPITFLSAAICIQRIVAFALIRGNCDGTRRTDSWWTERKLDVHRLIESFLAMHNDL